MITAEEAGRMVDYLDRRYGDLQKKYKELDREISLNRQMRDHYQQLWLSLEREANKK